VVDEPLDTDIAGHLAHNLSIALIGARSETEISGKTPDWKAARGTALEQLLSKKLCHSLNRCSRPKSVA